MSFKYEEIKKPERILDILTAIQSPLALLGLFTKRNDRFLSIS